MKRWCFGICPYRHFGEGIDGFSLQIAILSSNSDIAIEKGVCFAAEVGLAGEIRPVQRVDQRILEAEKLGFSKIFVSKNNKIGLKQSGIQIQKVSKIEDVVAHLFG